MNTAELAALLEQRNDAWKQMGHYHVPICELKPKDRENLEELTNRYHQADRAIVAHLQETDEPAVVGTMVLHLMSDRQHFIELDQKTGEPVYMSGNEKCGWKGLLYVYPKKARKSA